MGNTSPRQQTNLNWFYQLGNLEVILSLDKQQVITIVDEH